MLTACKKCKDPTPPDELSPEGDCFWCSTDTPPEGMVVNSAMLRESMDNIAAGLADKVVRTKAHVKKVMHAAAKDAKDGGFN